jgi:hypothetical protein
MISFSPLEPVVDKQGRLMPEWVGVFQLLAELDPEFGSGSPETVVSARKGRFYIDTAGSAGSTLYVKQASDISGDATKGWIQV